MRSGQVCRPGTPYTIMRPRLSPVEAFSTLEGAVGALKLTSP